MGAVVSDTTLRARRDEWIEAGVFDAIATEPLSAYDKIIGLDMSEVAVDGSLHKAPAGGEGTGKSPVERAKLAWKWSIATDALGIPIGWTVSASRRSGAGVCLVTSKRCGSTGATTERQHDSG